jgi:phenylacetate-CoA ligase
VTTSYFDTDETRDPATREAALMAALSRVVAAAKQAAPAYREKFAGIDPATVDNRPALAELPLTRKSELMALQGRNPPFGGFTTIGMDEVRRVFASPGPIYEIEARRPDFFRMARALCAAGVRAGDLIHNTFSYHLTPAGAMFESAALSLGCPVIPAGTGQTELQLKTIADLRPAVYVGTPSFLKILLDRAAETGIDIGSLKKAVVGAEAFPAMLRREFCAKGINALQCYGTADVGLIAYETMAPDGAVCDGMMVDEGVILELVEPGTGTPVAPGDVGEVVITTLTPEYPLIRFATGDLSALLAKPSPCGRTNQRIKGWLGRADQTTKVRGMFVHPAQIADIVKRHPEIAKARLVVDNAGGGDTMTLRCALTAPHDGGLAAAIAQSVQSVCKLRGEVAIVAAADLPNDGKVIEDRRKLD